MRNPNVVSQHPHRRRLQLSPLIGAILLAAVVGTGWYFLTRRSPQSALLTHTARRSAPACTTCKNPTPYLAPTTFRVPPSWKLYKSEYGYQYSYPPTWNNSSHVNGRSSGVSVPRTTGTIGDRYYDGQFLVELRSKIECELIPQNLPPGTKLQQMIVSGGYPVFQFERWEKNHDDDTYYRKSAFVVNDGACYYVYITSKNDPAQINVLNQIFSSFAFTNK